MLGQVIRQYREARGWKQETLAERSGLKQSYISRIERGTRSNVPLETLQALAGALEVPLDELIAAAGQDAPPAPPPLAGTVDLPASVARTIQRLGAQLTGQDWEIVNRILEGLAAQRATHEAAVQGRIAERRAAYGYQTPDMEDEAEGQDDPAGQQTA